MFPKWKAIYSKKMPFYSGITLKHLCAVALMAKDQQKSCLLGYSQADRARVHLPTPTIIG